MKLSRRRFLGTVLAAASVPTFARGSAPIALGVVGLGTAGLFWAEHFSRLADVRIAALCDADEGRLRMAGMAYPFARCFREAGALCASPAVDAVVVAVPDRAQAKISFLASRSGKAIFSELPFAFGQANARMLARQLFVAGTGWFAPKRAEMFPAIARAVATVRSGAIGSVARIELGLSGGGDVLRSVSEDWRWDRRKSYGALGAGLSFYGLTALAAANALGVGAAKVVCSASSPLGARAEATFTRFCCEATLENGIRFRAADAGVMPMGLGIRWVGADGRWVWACEGASRVSDGVCWAPYARSVDDCTTFIETFRRGTFDSSLCDSAQFLAMLPTSLRV